MARGERDERLPERVAALADEHPAERVRRGLRLLDRLVAHQHLADRPLDRAQALAPHRRREPAGQRLRIADGVHPAEELQPGGLHRVVEVGGRQPVLATDVAQQALETPDEPIPRAGLAGECAGEFVLGHGGDSRRAARIVASGKSLDLAIGVYSAAPHAGSDAA